MDRLDAFGSNGLFVRLLYLILTLLTVELQAQTCTTSSTNGDWLTGGHWSCSGASAPPDGAWAAGTTIVIDRNFAIGNNDDVDLTSSAEMITITVKAGATLTFGANATLSLPSGSTIVFEDGSPPGMIDASNNSVGMAIFIGGNGVWGRGGGASSNNDLTGPGTIDENSDPNNPLPIELLYFSGSASENVTTLTWATASEENFNYFSIQRAAGDLEFSEIGTVPGAGYSTVIRNYSFIDDHPLSGISYYRLKAVDFDGLFEIFEVIAVERESADVFRIFPTVVSPDSYLHIFSYWDSVLPSDMTLYDSAGRLILASHLTKGTNQVSLQDLTQTGVYIVKIVATGSIFTQRIVVQ